MIKIMKILTNGVLTLVCALFLCPNSFGQTPDCDKAVLTCQTQCGNSQIYNDDSGGILPNEHSNFKVKCATACSTGASACKASIPGGGCKEFYSQCAGKCPKTLIDSYADLTVRNTDSETKCRAACAEGMDVCQGAVRRSICQEAARACRADCAIRRVYDYDQREYIESNFEKGCSRACEKGYENCFGEPADSACETFFQFCEDGCPPGMSNAETGKEMNTDIVTNCRGACAAGRRECEKRK